MCIMHMASDIILYRKIFTLLNLYTSILHSYEIIYVLYLISSIMIHISACLTMKLSGLLFKIKVLWGYQKQPQFKWTISWKKEKGRTDINSTNMTPYGLSHLAEYKNADKGLKFQKTKRGIDLFHFHFEYTEIAST